MVKRQVSAMMKPARQVGYFSSQIDNLLEKVLKNKFKNKYLLVHWGKATVNLSNEKY